MTAEFNNTFNAGLLDAQALADGDVIIVSLNGDLVLINGSAIPDPNTGEFARLSNVNSITLSGSLTAEHATDFRIESDFSGLTILIKPGPGNDTVVGGPGSELILDGGGNNDLRGNGGNDLISAGPGNDILVGGDGNDSIFGFGGNDQIFGEAGRDTLDGGDGDDTLQGGTDNDTLQGLAGNDSLFGQGGDDSIGGGVGNDGYGFEGGGLGQDTLDENPGEPEGEDFIEFSFFSTGVMLSIATPTTQAVSPGNLTLSLTSGSAFEIIIGSPFDDTLIGNAIDNFLFGGAGRDSVSGGAGDDFLFGQAGNDTLEGDAGEDSLNAGLGDDSQQGGSGNDTYLFNANGTGDDVITDQTSEAPFSDSDLLDFSLFAGAISLDLKSTAAQTIGAGLTLTLTSSTMIENATGSANADLITGNDGGNLLSGGGSLDTLDGVQGNDTLRGGPGDDQLHGGLGDDSLEGEAGDDLYQFTTTWNADTILESAGDFNDTVDFAVFQGNLAFTIGSLYFVTDGISTLTHAGDEIEHLVGGIANDVFRFVDGAVLAGGIGIVDGGTGNDILDYSLYTTESVVDLAIAAATGLSSFTSINAMRGNSDSPELATLIGKDQPNVWTIDGETGNVNGDFTFTDVYGLAGGASTDRFLFHKNRSYLGGLLDGAGGADTIDFSAITSSSLRVNFQDQSFNGAKFADIEEFVATSKPGGFNHIDAANSPNVWKIRSS